MESLSKNQILTWQQAYEWEKLETPKFICFGSFPLTTDGKQFFKPFISAGYVHKDTLKFTGVFRLTDKGKTKFEELKAAL